MGVAHNKVYYEWFELARTEYCRDRGLTYREIEERGVYLVVAESHCRYRRPVRYDEIVLVRTVLSQISARKAVFAYELTTGDGSDLVARGYTVHVAVDREGRVSSLPPDVIERIGGNSAAAG
jgi:acyl-CoA thioester hydrolase